MDGVERCQRTSFSKIKILESLSTHHDGLAAVMQFFHEMTVPRNELAAVQTIAYSGPSQGLDALLNDEQRHALSSSAQNRQKQILINSAWWAENRSAIDKRWTEFRASL